MAAVQTVENFAVSCMSTIFGISVNQKYIRELVGIYLKHATAAVEQLTRNAAQYSVSEVENISDSFRSGVVEETKRLLMSVVEHAATLRECVERGHVSQVRTQIE